MFTYTNQRKKVNINVTVGSGDRMLKLTQYASSEADAKRQLEAAIAMKNHSNTTVSFKTMGDLNIHATQCVNIQGYGKMDGKYYLDSITRPLDNSGGLTNEYAGSRVGGRSICRA